MDLDLSLTKTDSQTIVNYDSNGLGPKLDKKLGVFLTFVNHFSNFIFSGGT